MHVLIERSVKNQPFYGHLYIMDWEQLIPTIGAVVVSTELDDFKSFETLDLGPSSVLINRKKNNAEDFPISSFVWCEASADHNRLYKTEFEANSYKTLNLNRNSRKLQSLPEEPLPLRGTPRGIC